LSGTDIGALPLGNKKVAPIQVELCKLQEWVRHKGLRIIVVFEVRDAAGKGGTIKALTERVSPRCRTADARSLARWICPRAANGMRIP
jgi:polyphosphate kinase 2 (PPK2 family)